MTEHDGSDPPIDPALQALLPLDTRHGPALKNRPDRNAALVESALGEWLAPGAPMAAPRRSTWSSLAMAASLLLGFGLAARALYIAAMPEQPEASAPPSSPSLPLTAPPSVAAEVPELPTPVREQARAAETRKARERASEDWLKRGNRLRAEGRFQDAVAAYNRAVRENSGASAYVARVAAASLTLDHLNDPRSAQALFLAARRQLPGGSLDVEIERGLAEASRRLVGSAEP